MGEIGKTKKNEKTKASKYFVDVKQTFFNYFSIILL
jgi:hypothetical protein